MVDGYCLQTCAAADRENFAWSMWRRARVTWAELQQMGRQALGAEFIPRSRIKVAIPREVTEDVDRFLVLRAANGGGRIIGYRTEATFNVVWFDTRLEVYEH